tara:strand:- start:252 stop:569 length:318 start_codon:yes stop_codon:yes gene_type:complete
MSTIISVRIEELSDLPVAKIRATLTLEDYKAADITSALKESGLSTKKVAFAETFYGWLAIEERDEDEVNAYIMGDGEFGETSSNVQKHLNHYVNIANLARTIWAQ